MVMSSASICVSRITLAPAASAESALASGTELAGGATSRVSRCRVQSPPRSTLVGMSGSGMMEPTSSPSPVNSNDVT
jgi:hypothetical protein